jgi:NRPS condensation-like uncharacterized protein
MNCIDKVLLSYEVGHQRMIFHLILSVQGQVEPSRLKRAILSVLQFHPTMRTTVCRSMYRSLRSVRDDCGERILEVADSAFWPSGEDGHVAWDQYENSLSEWINRPLDPSKELPVRALLLRKGEAEYSLIFTFHHSAIDGLRSVRFIEEVLARYDHRDPFETALSADLPKQRDGDELMALAGAERRRVPRFRRAMLSYMFHFLVMTPFRRSSRIFHDGPGQELGIDFCSGRVDAARFQQMKSTAKSIGATANDILMAAAFKTIDKWNRLHRKDSDKISLMVPVNVAGEDLRHFAANLVSFISVATCRSDRVDSTELLRKVNSESASALKENRGSAFAYVYFSYVLSRLPLPAMKAFARLIKFPIYADTVLHSNLGVVRLGVDDGKKRYRIIDFTAVTPVVDVMGMFLCISTYNGVLGIDLTYGTGFFRREEAEKFLALYLDELENYRVEADGGWRPTDIPTAVKIA